MPMAWSMACVERARQTELAETIANANKAIAAPKASLWHRLFKRER